MSENDTPTEGAATSTEGSAPASSETSSASVETAASTGTDSAPTTDGGGSTGGPTTEGSNTSFGGDWNGEMESVRAADWFNGLGTKAKQTVLAGLENKYKNWQRGYTDKFEEMSKRRKTMEDREERIRMQESRVQKWLYGNEDPITDLKKEIKSLEEEKAKVAADFEQKMKESLAEAQETGKVDYDKVLSERDSAMKAFNSLRERVEAAEQAKLEEEVDSWDSWLKTEAPDLYADFEDEELVTKRDDAFEWFCKLAATGMNKEMALAMLRSQFPKIEAPEPEPEVVEEQPKAAEPEPVPESVSLMNMGTGQASTTTPSDPRTFEEMMDAMRRAAQNSL
jgi:hypothetical protein